MLEKIQAILDEYKAEDVCVMELPEVAFASHMLVASGTSARHLWTLVDKVERAMREVGVCARIEGDAGSDWVVLDLGDVVLHCFTPEKRRLYDLEGLWSQCAQALKEEDSTVGMDLMYSERDK